MSCARLSCLRLLALEKKALLSQIQGTHNQNKKKHHDFEESRVFFGLGGVVLPAVWCCVSRGHLCSAHASRDVSPTVCTGFLTPRYFPLSPTRPALSKQRVGKPAVERALVQPRSRPVAKSGIVARCGRRRGRERVFEAKADNPPPLPLPLLLFYLRGCCSGVLQSLAAAGSGGVCSGPVLSAC